MNVLSILDFVPCKRFLGSVKIAAVLQTSLSRKLFSWWKSFRLWGIRKFHSFFICFMPSFRIFGVEDPMGGFKWHRSCCFNLLIPLCFWNSWVPGVYLNKVSYRLIFIFWYFLVMIHCLISMFRHNHYSFSNRQRVLCLF